MRARSDLSFTVLSLCLVQDLAPARPLINTLLNEGMNEWGPREGGQGGPRAAWESPVCRIGEKALQQAAGSLGPELRRAKACSSGGSSVQARVPGRGRDRGDLPCQKRPLGHFGVTQMSAPLPQTLRESLESSQEFARVTRPPGDCHVS